MAAVSDYLRGWRTTRRALISALMVVVLGFTVAPVAEAAAVTATLTVTSTWQTGFIGRFSIINSTSVPLSDWVLEFDLPAGESISHTWNSTVRQSGTHYVLTPANWNRIIAPGGSATGGMRGVLSGSYLPPSNCVLNRRYRCT